MDICTVPRTQTLLGDRVFAVAVANPPFWNSLPTTYLRPFTYRGLGEFKRLLKLKCFGVVEAMSTPVRPI